MGLLVLVVVAVPAGWTALLAYISFSGCFLECRETQPVRGIVWASITVALLACPVLAGLMTAKARRRDFRYRKSGGSAGE